MKSPWLIAPDSGVNLKKIDSGDRGGFSDSSEAKKDLLELQGELVKLQNIFYADGRYALLVILQGMDASGKDGTIRSVLSNINPMGVRVHSFKKPTDQELLHDYLWRIHREVPRRGMIGVFNRSHYEDVLIVRVHKLVSGKVWKKRFEEINAFEKYLVENNVIILKFFLHISREEQKKRFEERLNNPAKHWKFSPADTKERAFWKEYQKAYEEVLRRCSTPWAPWQVVPADHKWYRNYRVARSVVESMKKLDLSYPKPSFDPSTVEIEP